jgi:hypothetical protein
MFTSYPDPLARKSPIGWDGLQFSSAPLKFVGGVRQRIARQA